MEQMTTTDFATTLLVDKSPEEAFRAILNIRGWWSEEIEGNTENLNEEFTYHYKDVHRCKMKLTELVPNKKVVWLVMDNYFNFTNNQSEWKGTKIQFGISGKGKQTEIVFTHLGLVPEYECFDICSDAWTQYIRQSLYNLITTGKGQPNAGEDYHAEISVHASAHDVFSNINSVSKWWTEDLKGSSQKLNDEFTVRFGEVHVSTQKIIELVPDKKMVWLVSGSKLNFIKDKDEWTNTKIIFELSGQGGQTTIHFTHRGLVPGIECFKDCTKGWDYYIKGSLYKLLKEGKGTPGTK